MAEVIFARNIRDYNLNDAACALPAVNANTHSDEWDLGPGRHVTDLEISVDLPLLTTTHMVNALTTLTTCLVSSDTAGDQANATEVGGTRKAIVGTGSNIAAQSFRIKVPSEHARYVSVRFGLLGAGSNAATANATNVGPRF